MSKKQTESLKISLLAWIFIIIWSYLAGQMLSLHVSNIWAKVNNKELFYFNGNLSYYNPTIDKRALIIGDARPIEQVMGCEKLIPPGYLENINLYPVYLYTNHGKRTLTLVHNNQYKRMYGIDHPCYEASKV